MSSEPVKICPTCNCEYVVSAEICADCGGLLKFPEELRANGEQETVGEIRELDPAGEAEAGRLRVLELLKSPTSARNSEDVHTGKRSIKICPTCRTEYQLSAQLCADCGVTLQFMGSVAGPNRGATGVGGSARGFPEPLPESSDLACLRITELSWIRDLHARLSDEGIPIRLEVEETDGSRDIHRWVYRLLVRPRDLDAAAAVDRAYLCEQMPEAAEALPSGSNTPGRCPACGANVRPDSSSCPECDLAFPEEESREEPAAE